MSRSSHVCERKYGHDSVKASPGDVDGVSFSATCLSDCSWEMSSISLSVVMILCEGLAYQLPSSQPARSWKYMVKIVDDEAEKLKVF
jgi:hypothetical protein